MSIYSYLSKRANIPGTPKGSDFGIMNTKSDSEIMLSLKPKNVATNAAKTTTSYYYFDSINPFVCGLVFIGMTVVGIFIALTVNYKTRAMLDNLKSVKEQDISKDIELGELDVADEASPKEIPLLNNLQYYDKYMFDLVYDDDILKQHNNISKNSARITKKNKKANSIESEKITNSGTTLLSNGIFLRENNNNQQPTLDNTFELNTDMLEKDVPVKRLPAPEVRLIEQLYCENITGGLQIDKKVNYYSYEYMTRANKIDDYEPEINLKNFKNCPITLQMHPFENKKSAMKSIKVINHFLFKGKVPLTETYTIEILLLKLVTMLVNATENGYCYQKNFCEGMQNFFNKGIISEYFFAIDNYLLQDCLVSAFLDYFQGHCMFPYLGNTSFINYTYQITDGFQVDDIYNESFGMVITMFLNFHMLFEKDKGKYHDALAKTHNEYIGRKLNEFLDYYLNLIPNSDNSNTNGETSYVVNQVVNKLLKSVRIMEDQKNADKVFLYLQSILKIYTKHQICCLKKKNNAHISLETDENVYSTMMDVLDTFGDSNHLIIKVIKSFSLILEDEGFPEELYLKLEEVINKENHQPVAKPKVEKLKNNNAPLNVQPGAWNI